MSIFSIRLATNPDIPKVLPEPNKKRRAMSKHIKYLELSLEEQLELETVERKPSSPQGLAQRCRIILMTAEGRRVEEIESILKTTRATIRKWKDRYIADGFDGLYDSCRSGRERRKYDTRTRLKIASFAKKAPKAANEKPPEGRRFWTIRTLAEFLGINRGIVQRVLKNESINLKKIG